MARLLTATRRSPIRSIHRVAAAAVTAVVASIVLAGCGEVGGGRSDDALAIRLRPGSVPARDVEITGGSAAQRAAVRTLVAHLARINDIARIEITAPPSREYGVPARSAWLRFDVDATTHATSVRAAWETLIVIGAFRETSIRNRLPAVGGRSASVNYPDGHAEDFGTGVIGQRVPDTGSPLATTELARRARAGVNAAHARLVRIDVLDAAAPISVVLVETTDPERFVANRPANLQHILGPLAYGVHPGEADGAYLEVEDSTGAIVTASGYSNRLHEGVGWTNPAFSPGSVTRR